MLRLLACVVLLGACSSAPKGPGTGGSGGGGGSGGESPPAEVCDNHIDDDGNGQADCADPACASDPHCPFCGDGIRQGNEECDGDVDPAVTCKSKGFNGGGALRCKIDCTIDTSRCTSREICDMVGDEDGNGLADCSDPACSALDSCLALDVAPLPTSIHVLSQLALSFHAADGAGNPLVGHQVQIVAPMSQAAPTTEVTDTGGMAHFTIRVGPQITTQTITATLDGGKVTREVPVNASMPPPGTIQTIVDADRIRGTDSSGPAVTAHVGAPTGVQVASDGTLYVAEACRVMAVAPDGTLSLFAGDGFCGTAPTTGDARDQTLTIDGMALDDPHHRLVVIDRAGGLVRTVDLQSHQLGLLGGGGAKAPKQAIGGKATDAILDPAVVSVAPDGTVAFVEAVSQQVLSIDAGGTLNLVAGSRKSLGTDCGALSLDTCASGCSVFYDAAGTAFVGGSFCGTDAVAATAGGTTTPGVVRVGPGIPASMARIAGHLPGVLPGSVAADHAQLPAVSAAAFDPAGNMLVVTRDDILRIDGVNGQAEHVGGSGTAAFSGEDVPVALARFRGPQGIAVASNGDIYIADTGNGCVRRVVGPGPGTATLHLKAISGDGQIAMLAQPLPDPLKVQLTDDNGEPLAGVWIRTVPGAPGLGAGPPVITDDQGIASVTGRLGLVSGAATFQVALNGIHAAPPDSPSVTFEAVAKKPPAGTIFTIAGNGDGSGAGLLGPDQRVAAPGAPIGITRVKQAPDGTIYMSSAAQILRLEDDGTLSLVAGNGVPNQPSVTGVKATNTPLAVSDFLFDDAGRTLYVSEFTDVRAIDLSTMMVSAFAGPGGGMPGDGDGGPAIAATFGFLLRIALDNTGAMYLGGFSGGIRRIDPKTGNIDTFMKGIACDAGGMPGDWAGGALGMLWLEDTLWLAGSVCPSEFDVLRRDPDASLHVYHTNGGTLYPASDGGILVGAFNGTLVELDPASGTTTPIAGADQRPRGGDYGPAIDAGLGFVLGLMTDTDGHTYVSDGALREIW